MNRRLVRGAVIAALVVMTATPGGRGAEPLESIRAATMRPPTAPPPAVGSDAEGLAGRVLCGYQGWFNAPADGAGLGWRHWSRDGRRPPAADNLHVDLLPDVSELAPEDRHASGLRKPDGAPVELFSSLSAATVDCHFRWMAEYGIDGAFVQRFAAPLTSPPHLRNCTIVLGHCRDAAVRRGRVFAVMYDITGLRAGKAATLIEDWRALRDRMRITESPAYLRLGGRPLVAVWGIGFKGRDYTLADCREMIAALAQDGCAVMAGVPTGWRTLDRDAAADEGLHELLARCDVVSPWTVGRYNVPADVTRHAGRDWKPDMEWCRGRGVDYMPVVFPGFSWRNLHGGPLDQIPRRRGEFLWRQFAEAGQAGAASVYVAMFDECDEATAIFKCVEPPAGDLSKQLIGYEGLPSDHYLRLTGEAGNLLRARRPFPEKPPF
jgi:hypothetical protein